MVISDKDTNAYLSGENSVRRGKNVACGSPVVVSMHAKHIIY